MAFTALEGSFKPTVIFFGLTNSPAMFQIIMNKILQNLNNTIKVVSFIDDDLVGIEEDQRHNEVIEEIVRKLAENVKPEEIEGHESRISEGSNGARSN